MAKVEHGDVSNWDREYLVLDTGNSDYKTQGRDAGYKFFSKYLLPYLRVSKTEKCSLADMGYKEPIKNPDGDSYMPLTAQSTFIALADGAVFTINYSLSEDSIAGQDNPNLKYLFCYLLQVDINGPKSPNVLGKDVFLFVYPIGYNAKLYFWGAENPKFYTSEGRVDYLDVSRDDILESCNKAEGISCGALIQYDGWKISDDYPW